MAADDVSSPDFWENAFTKEELSLDTADKGEQYRTVPPDVIAETYEEDPMKAFEMQKSNDILRHARAQAEGMEVRKKSLHEVNWRFSIETPKGLVGVWNNYDGSRLFLSYPRDSDLESPVSDSFIMDILDLAYAQPVKVVSALATTNKHLAESMSDEDKPSIPQEGFNSHVFYREKDYLKKYAEFWGPQEPTGGRVWFTRENIDTLLPFPLITAEGEYKEVLGGWMHTNSFGTYDYEHSNPYAPDAPTNNPQAVQRYRDKFLRLASEIAFKMGGPSSATLNLGFSLVPEDLYRESYQDIEWLEGEFGERKGGLQEIVRAKKGDSTVFLRSGNDFIPWETTLRAPIGGIKRPDALANFIADDILYF